MALAGGLFSVLDGAGCVGLRRDLFDAAEMGQTGQLGFGFPPFVRGGLQLWIAGPGNALALRATAFQPGKIRSLDPCASMRMRRLYLRRSGADCLALERPNVRADRG